MSVIFSFVPLSAWRDSTPWVSEDEFYLKRKASFIDMVFLFLIVWLREYCTFSDSFVVSLKSSLWPKYTQLGTIFPQKLVFHYQNFFASSRMLLIRLFLANTWKKNQWSPCSFKGKGEFISLSSLVWGKSLSYCKCTLSCARANDAKMERCRNAQCNILRNYLNIGLLVDLTEVSALYAGLFYSKFWDSIEVVRLINQLPELFAKKEF